MGSSLRLYKIITLCPLTMLAAVVVNGEITILLFLPNFLASRAWLTLGRCALGGGGIYGCVPPQRARLTRDNSNI